MSYINKIAYHLNRRDEVPNQELAKELAEKRDVQGIEEISGFLNDKNKSIASDCLKVLYEIGYLAPDLIVPYTEQFLNFLNSKNNRMVWGAMIGLASIAKVAPKPIFMEKQLILNKIETGSVITNIWGVYTIANMAGSGYYDELREVLISLQVQCRNVDFPKRAETIAAVLEQRDVPLFVEILEKRLPELSAAGKKNVEKLMKRLEQ